MRAGFAAVLPVVGALLAGAALGSPAAVAGQDDDPVRRGGTVFQTSCAACHGTTGEGRAGSGIEAGPDITGVPVAYVDLVLRTGRMPIAHAELGVREDRLDDRDREAVVAWMQREFELAGSVPEPVTGDAAAGREPFVRHCAACHGAGGVGGVAGGGTFVPAIAGDDPVTIVEALRVGPFEMPAFSEAVVDEREAADIAAYLQAADDAPRTLLGLEEVDPVATAIAGAALLAATVGILFAVTRRPGREDDR